MAGGVIFSKTELIGMNISLFWIGSGRACSARAVLESQKAAVRVSTKLGVDCLTSEKRPVESGSPALYNWHCRGEADGGEPMTTSSGWRCDVAVREVVRAALAVLRVRDEADVVHAPLLDVVLVLDGLEGLRLVLERAQVDVPNVREAVVLGFRVLVAAGEDELGLLDNYKQKGLIGRNQSAPACGFHRFFFEQRSWHKFYWAVCLEGMSKGNSGPVCSQ